MDDPSTYHQNSVTDYDFTNHVVNKDADSCLREDFDSDSGLVISFDDSDSGKDFIPDQNLHKFKNICLSSENEKGDDNLDDFQNVLNNNSENIPTELYFDDFGSDKEYNDLEWEDNAVEITEESEGSGGTLENSVSMMSDDDIFQDNSFEMKEISDIDGSADDQSVTISNIFEVISKKLIYICKRIGKFLTSMHIINFENDLVKLVMQARYVSKLHQPGLVFLVR